MLIYTYICYYDVPFLVLKGISFTTAIYIYIYIFFRGAYANGIV